MKSNKMILLGYRDTRCKLYTPKKNKKRMWGFLTFSIICLVTPCTNWMIPVVAKGLNKINPLWMYA